MIKSGEIQQKARTVGVRDQQIEKDYILSWILRSISQHTQLSKAILFKGAFGKTAIFILQKYLLNLQHEHDTYKIK